MPLRETRAKGALAIVQDILDALHMPGGNTLGELIEKEIRERSRAAFEALLDEMQKGRDEGVTFDESDAHDFVQMVLRLSDAARKGTARRNLRLLAQVIVGLKRHRLFQFDNFQIWAPMLETLTRDEILVLGAFYRAMQREGHAWSLVKFELIPKTFQTEAELGTVGAALMRTGLLVPIPAAGSLVFNPSPRILQLGQLAELKSAAR